MVSSASAGPPFWLYAIPTESPGGDTGCPLSPLLSLPSGFAVATKSGRAAALEAAVGKVSFTGN